VNPAHSKNQIQQGRSFKMSASKEIMRLLLAGAILRGGLARGQNVGAPVAPAGTPQCVTAEKPAQPSRTLSWVERQLCKHNKNLCDPPPIDTPQKPSSCVVAPPVTPPAPAVAAPAAVTTGSVADTQLAKIAGIWSGAIVQGKRGLCVLHLEIRLNPDKPGSYAGFSTYMCADSFGSGPKPTQEAIEKAIASMRAEFSPVSSILSGSSVGGAIVLHVEQSMGTAPDDCIPTVFTLRPFGESALAVTWKAGPSLACMEGQTVMHRTS
jgi:hypothetical protein